ncbi:MAG: hypothetical protein WBP64_20545 [Nitrososphaeraceae archaeon]
MTINLRNQKTTRNNSRFGGPDKSKMIAQEIKWKHPETGGNYR